MDRYVAANATLSLFSKNYMDLKKTLPIRPSEMGVLNIITETDGQYTPVMLAEMLGVTKQMITAHIRSLESKGYICKEACLRDKRAYYILPTASGRALVAMAKVELNETLDALVQGLGQEEFQTLVELTKKATELLKERNGSQKGEYKWI